MSRPPTAPSITGNSTPAGSPESAAPGAQAYQDRAGSTKSREVDGRDEKITQLTGGHSDGELVEHIRAVLSASVFLGEGYRKVWAKLRHRGIRTSRGRVLRLMREHELRAPTRSGAPRGPRSHEGTIIPPAPNMRWDGSDRSNATASDRPLSGAVTHDAETQQLAA